MPLPHTLTRKAQLFSDQKEVHSLATTTSPEFLTWIVKQAMQIQRELWEVEEMKTEHLKEEECNRNPKDTMKLFCGSWGFYFFPWLMLYMCMKSSRHEVTSMDIHPYRFNIRIVWGVPWIDYLTCKLSIEVEAKYGLFSQRWASLIS